MSQLHAGIGLRRHVEPSGVTPVESCVALIARSAFEPSLYRIVCVSPTKSSGCAERGLLVQVTQAQAVLDSASPPNLQHQKCMVPTLHAESHSFVIAVLCRCGRSFSNAFRCIRSSGLSLGLHKFMIPLHWHARILLSVGIGIRRVVRVKQTNAFKIASGQCGSRMPLVSPALWVLLLATSIFLTD